MRKVAEEMKEAEREKKLLPKANVSGRSRDLKKRQMSTRRRDESGTQKRPGSRAQSSLFNCIQLWICDSRFDFFPTKGKCGLYSDSGTLETVRNDCLLSPSWGLLLLNASMTEKREDAIEDELIWRLGYWQQLCLNSVSLKHPRFRLDINAVSSSSPNASGKKREGRGCRRRPTSNRQGNK